MPTETQWALIIGVLSLAAIIAFGIENIAARRRARVQLTITAHRAGGNFAFTVSNRGLEGTSLRRGYLRWGEDKNYLDNSNWDLPVGGLVIPAGGQPVDRLLDISTVRQYASNRPDVRWIGVEDDRGNVAQCQLPTNLTTWIAGGPEA